MDLGAFNRGMAARLGRNGHPLRHHLIGVARLSARLAVRAGCDPAVARAAGYLHDWARPLPARRLSLALRRYRVRLDPGARAIPELWHGPVAAEMARREHGISHPGVLRAVRIHTTGCPRASTAELCLIVADFCEPGRRFREARVARRLARRNLKLAANYVASSRIAYLKEAGIVPHPSAVAFLSGLAASPTKSANAKLCLAASPAKSANANSRLARRN